MSGNRRQYTAEFKTKVVLQVLMGEKTKVFYIPPGGLRLGNLKYT